MATTQLQAESAAVTPTFSDLWHEWRHAKARWEAVLYAPEHRHQGVPDDVEDPLADAHIDALNRMLLHPVQTHHNLVQKLEAYNSECLFNGWDLAQEIAATLLADARRLARSAGEA